jgi:hypothetical protein
MSNSRSVRDALHIARQHYEGGGWVPDWLSGLFSSEPKTPPDPKTVTYPDASESMRHMPTDKDMEDARKYGQYYGTPLDSFINPGQAVSRVINDPLLSADVANNALYNKVPSRLVDQEMADAYLTGALATGNSAISALGYDPRNAVSTRPSKSLALTVRGQYAPSQDAIWWGGEQPSTMAHESFHRGMEKLAQMEAKSPSGLLKENDIKMLNVTAAEPAARALMEKYLGKDVEMKNATKGDIGERQILMSRYFAKDHADALDRAEKAAAYHYAKKTPRGPRASGGSVVDHALVLTSKKAASRRGRPE